MLLGRTLARKTSITFGSCLLAAAAAGLAAMASPASAGTVTLLGQERKIDAGVSYAFTDTQPSDSHSKSAPDFGVFNDAVTAHVTHDTASATASTSVDSRLGQDGFFFKGVMSWNLSDESQSGGLAHPSVEVDFRVDFSIDEPYHYDLGGARNVTGSAGGSEGDSRIQRIDHPDTFFPGEGVIPAGTYRLTISQFAERLGGPSVYEDQYEDHLALSPVSAGGGGGGDNGGGGGHAVPLPPAVWSGTLVLGAGALNRLRKRFA